MANYETTQDLKASVLRRIGELQDGTSDYNAQVLEYLNEVHQAIISGGHEFNTEIGEAWFWARAKEPVILTLQPKITTGSVSLTNGSVAGTFSSAPSVSVAGWHLKLDGKDEVFRIVLHTAASSSFTLDAPYPDLSATNHGYTLFKVDYDLVDDEFLVTSANNKIDFKVRKKLTLDFDADFVASNVINLNVNGVAMNAVTFATSHANTLSLLAAQLNSDFSEIDTASVTGARQITIVGTTAGGAIDFTGIAVTLGASQANGTTSTTQAETERTATLTVGNYSSSSLIAHIETQLEGAVSTENTFTISFSSVTRKFTLSHDGVVVNFLFGTGTNARLSPSALLGFSPKDFTGSTSYVSEIASNAILRLIDPMVVHKPQRAEVDDEQKIFMMDQGSMSSYYPITDIEEAIPTKFCQLRRSQEGIITVRFNSYPKEATRVEIDHIPVPLDLQDTANSIPLMPREYRAVLDYGASYYAALDKDDSKSQSFLALAQAKLQALQQAYRREMINTGKRLGFIIPRRDMMPGRRMLKTTSGVPIE